MLGDFGVTTDPHPCPPDTPKRPHCVSMIAPAVRRRYSTSVGRALRRLARQALLRPSRRRSSDGSSRERSDTPAPPIACALGGALPRVFQRDGAAALLARSHRECLVREPSISLPGLEPGWFLWASPRDWHRLGLSYLHLSTRPTFTTVRAFLLASQLFAPWTKLGWWELNPRVTYYPFNALSGRGDTPHRSQIDFH